MGDDPRYIDDPFVPPVPKGFVLDKPQTVAPADTRFQWNDPKAPPPGFTVDPPDKWKQYETKADDPRFKWDKYENKEPTANPFEPVTITPDAPPPPRAVNAGDKVVAGTGEHGFRGWLSDLEDDVRYGTGNTVIGRALQKMGAPGINVGSQGNSTAGDTLASPVLGPIKAAKGAIDVTQSGKRWAGTKELVGGALQTAEIPLSFGAPETGDAAANVAGQVADRVAASKAGTLLSKVKGALWVPDELKTAAAEVPDAATTATAARTATQIKTGAAQALNQTLHSELDSVASEVGADVSNVSNASTKAARIGDTLQKNAQAIYSKADEIAAQVTGQPGRFQDIAHNIDELRSELRFERDPELKAKLTKALSGAVDDYESYKAGLQQAGMDLQGVKSADKLWSQGTSYKEVGTTIGRSTRLSGDLIPSSNPLDSNIRRLAVEGQQRGHVLENAMGADRAQRVTDAVQRAGEQVAQETAATRQAKDAIKQTTQRTNMAQTRIIKIRGNQKTAATAAGVVGGGTAAVLKILSGEKGN